VLNRLAPVDLITDSGIEGVMGTYMGAFVEIDHSDGSRPFSDPVLIYSLTDGG
jgi:hypothetical protein